MTSEELTVQTYAERERLAGLLSALHPEQWAAPSLCQGWRVREVVAHITMPYRTSDTEARLGEGTATRLPARDILLIATGRNPL